MAAMDGIISFSSIIFFYILLLLIHLVEKPMSLNIELTHPFSPNSPFYDPNITYSELIERFDSRPRPLGKTISDHTFPGMKVVRPKLEYSKWGFHAKLNLGTFHGEEPPYKTSYLHFDTASDLIWLECQDCAKPWGRCFREHDLAYPNRKSMTYASLIYGQDPLCIPDLQVREHCMYNQQYGDNSYSIGILAYENFTFDSSHTHPVEDFKIVIGCGFHNQLSNILNPNEAGVMGMGWNPLSFVNQLNTYTDGRFSYCLPPLFSDAGRPAVLRFGPDTPTVHGLDSLTIHRHWPESAYFVKLQGISINNRRLHIPPEYFAKTSLDKDGCFFDTGATHSVLPRNVYRILKEEMINYLSTTDRSLRVGEKKGNFDLCFERDSSHKGYAHFPAITFHFEEGADFVIQHNIAFINWPHADTKTFCMIINPAGEDNFAVIGAQAQANHVIVYDLPSKKMYFGPQDCAQNP